MDTITCPLCDKSFEIEEYSSGECECGNEYWSDEWCTDDYEECNTFYDWEKYRKDE